MEFSIATHQILPIEIPDSLEDLNNRLRIIAQKVRIDAEMIAISVVKLLQFLR